jgi:hypothetical protein
MHNKIFVTILCFFLMFSFISPINAQEEEFEYFNIDLEIGTQSVWNKSIPLTIYIKPERDFNRVEVTFAHSSLLDVRYRGAQYFPVIAGETYKLDAKIYPDRPGTHKITVSAIAWEYNTNYTSTDTIQLEIDEMKQISPQTDRYKLFNVLRYIFFVVFFAGLGVGLFFVGKKSLKKLQAWLKPEF